MTLFEAIILGIVQGLTEFLPVSSSGHLEIGKVLLGADVEESLIFTVVVHGATVLSTVAVFFHEIVKLIRESLTFKMNASTMYILKILLSMLPVMIAGLLFEEEIEAFFSGNLVFVGSMLLVTATLLFLTSMVKREGKKKILFVDAIIIGLAQAMAVLPGISRSGSTIATGVILGKDRGEVAKFSFLMVLIPIIGANMLSLMDSGRNFDIKGNSTILIAGFAAAFISGLVACKWMVEIVKKGRLIYFAIYCLIIGLIAIIFG